jgi:hypothetical protein
MQTFIHLQFLFAILFQFYHHSYVMSLPLPSHHGWILEYKELKRPSQRLISKLASEFKLFAIDVQSRLCSQIITFMSETQVEKKSSIECTIFLFLFDAMLVASSTKLFISHVQLNKDLCAWCDITLLLQCCEKLTSDHANDEDMKQLIHQITSIWIKTYTFPSMEMRELMYEIAPYIL